MADNALGEFWELVKAKPVQIGNEIADELRAFGNIPSKASAIAERNFPNSARDSSEKNAFRHALGTGMLTQALGNRPASALAAKGIGYIWEGLSLPQLRADAAHRTDTLHDLNANALGAAAALKSKDQESLERSLKELAKASRQESPPSFFSASPGYMTRSAK